MKPTVISVSITKGGSGKTTTAVNISAGLAKAGKKTLLIDFDPQENATKLSGMIYKIDGKHVRTYECNNNVSNNEPTNDTTHEQDNVRKSQIRSNLYNYRKLLQQEKDKPKSATDRHAFTGDIDIMIRLEELPVYLKTKGI